MAISGDRLDRNRGFFVRLKIILEMIKFEHTIFALPFAFIGAMLAAHQMRMPYSLPSGRTVGWILAAMVGARSAAMAFNRLVDARFDAMNPRTAKRALPAGQLTVPQVVLFTVASVVLFETAAFALNPLCLALSPLALLAILGYSFTKRFTAFSHLALGFGIGIAPIGAWVAVTGSLSPLPILLGAVVMLWISGFDIIYALQDEGFDRKIGLHSLPQRLGKARALWVSRILHGVMLCLLLLLGGLVPLHLAYYVGVVFAAVLIGYEHSIVSPDDLSRVNVAFFTLNGWVSVSLFLFVLLDLVLLA